MICVHRGTQLLASEHDYKNKSNTEIYVQWIQIL